jgi:hypothetical protein
VFIYVRGAAPGDKDYHWFAACPNYPTRLADASFRRPSSLCPVCKATESGRETPADV